MQSVHIFPLDYRVPHIRHSYPRRYVQIERYLSAGNVKRKETGVLCSVRQDKASFHVGEIDMSRRALHVSAGKTTHASSHRFPQQKRTTSRHKIPVGDSYKCTHLYCWGLSTKWIKLILKCNSNAENDCFPVDGGTTLIRRFMGFFHFSFMLSIFYYCEYRNMCLHILLV